MRRNSLFETNQRLRRTVLRIPLFATFLRKRLNNWSCDSLGRKFTDVNFLTSFFGEQFIVLWAKKRPGRVRGRSRARSSRMMSNEFHRTALHSLLFGDRVQAGPRRNMIITDSPGRVKLNKQASDYYSDSPNCCKMRSTCSFNWAKLTCAAFQTISTSTSKYPCTKIWRIPII
jgi:hypothetical protein